MRYRPATRAVAIAFLALGFAAVLNTQGLRKTAEIQPAGFRRDLALAVTRRLVDVSHFLYLDRPRQELKAAIGRGGDDRVDTRVVLSGPTEPARVVRRRVVTKRVAPVVVHRRVLPAFTPKRPLRIWVAGDSLVAVPGQSLERAAVSNAALDVLPVESRIATGLGRPEVYNWYERIREAIAKLHPRVAVFEFGSNDDHDYMSGVPAGRKLGPLGSPSWVAEYTRRVDGVTRELERAGIVVVWIGLPVTRGEGRNRGFRVINRILDEIARRYPRTAIYVDTYRRFEDAHLHYAAYVPDAHGRLVLMRTGDGVHFQPPAGDPIARAVINRLGELYDLTSWRRK